MSLTVIVGQGERSADPEDLAREFKDNMIAAQTSIATRTGADILITRQRKRSAYKQQIEFDADIECAECWEEYRVKIYAANAREAMRDAREHQANNPKCSKCLGTPQNIPLTEPQVEPKAAYFRFECLIDGKPKLWQFIIKPHYLWSALMYDVKQSIDSGHDVSEINLTDASAWPINFKL